MIRLTDQISLPIFLSLLYHCIRNSQIQKDDSIIYLSDKCHKPESPAAPQPSDK